MALTEENGYWQDVVMPQHTLRPVSMHSPMSLDIGTFLQILTLAGVCLVVGMMLMQRNK